MTIVFDKNLDSNILELNVNGITGDLFKWNIAMASSYVVDSVNFKISIGAIGAVITFKSLEAMTPYIASIDNYNTLFNPISNGILTDPFYDKIPSGAIQSHSYVDTNIEQDLIDGDS